MASNKGAILIAITAASVTAAGFLLNPSPERHRDRIRSAVEERSPLAGALGVGALRAFVSEYHSLGVASYTTVGEETVSIGALGLVFVLDPGDDRE
jgi:hypothetical protein